MPTRCSVGRFPHPGARSDVAARGRVAVGVDVVDVPRFTRLVALRGPTMTARVFLPTELATCRGSPRRLAARLAAKEAGAKALGLGIGPLAWRDVEVRTGARGAPVLELHGAARAAARAQGLDRWSVSLSHDATRAVAFVVATEARRAGR